MASPQRVLFLDIDGVLNNHAHLRKRWSALRPLDVAVEKLDPECVMRLDEIARRGRATVVVHSTWRWQFDPSDLDLILRRCGYTGHYYGSLPLAAHDNGAPDDDFAGPQIEAWLKRHRRWVRGFAILDDNDVSPLDARHVKTSSETGGMLQEHVERALAILEREATC